MDKWKLPLFVVLIQLLVILPVTFYVATFFVGITWGVSLIIVPIVIPIVVLMIMTRTLDVFENRIWRQGLKKGIRFSFAFWLLVWFTALLALAMNDLTPSLRKKKFATKYENIARLTGSKVLWMDNIKADIVMNGEIIRMQNDSDGVCFSWTMVKDSIPKMNQKALLKFVSVKGLIFLNIDGRRALLNAIRNNEVHLYKSTYPQMRVGKTDREILICSPIGNKIKICIKNSYLI